MAAITSPQPEGLIIDPKQPAKIEMASLADEVLPTSNGINGHPSPVATPPDSAADANTPSKLNATVDKIEATESSDSSNKQNHEAFTSNQAIPEPTAEAAKDPIPGPSSSSDPPAAEQRDSEMADTAATDAPPAPADATTPTAEKSEQAPVGAAAAAEEATPIVEVASAEATAAETKLDVEMGEAPSHPSAAEEAPASREDETAANTQLSDAPVVSSQDVSFHPASMSRLALDGSQEEEQISVAVTADTSMTDALSQPTAKVAREREDDDNDDMGEPSAKRARTEDREVIVGQPEAAPAEAAGDAMAVDTASTTELPPRERPLGEPGSLGDKAQENQPISAFANREIRKVLAGVKKTKAGVLFKDPVSAKWPQLWESYTAKIEKPVDITAMERKLRESEYTTLGDFVNDVYLIYENAIRFNGKEHDVTGQAVSLVNNIFVKLAEIPAEEPAKPAKPEKKQIGTRHAEPRNASSAAAAAAAAAATAAASSAAAPRRESRGAATSPADEVVAESPVFAVPSSTGVPIIRRDSTKNDSDRPKRPIHPPKNKDPAYEVKNLKKKKMSPDFRFCDEVLKELMKSKHWEENQWFLKPVDPVQDNLPTYHKLIKKPMDLSTMQGKLNRGEYNSVKDVENDFHLIIKNCVKFNGDNSPVTEAARKLEARFNQKWAEKDEWMAQHAPPPAPAASPGAVAEAESDDDAEGSDHEVEEEEAPQTSETLDSLNARLREEQNRLTDLLNAAVPDDILIQTQQALLNMVMSGIVAEKKKLNEAPKKPAKPAKSKAAAKPKKAAGGSGGSKRASAAGGGSGGSKRGGGAGKKAAPKARALGQAEKNVVANGINLLEGNALERAIDIIKKDTNQEESDEGELELDIEQLSPDALAKLYDLVVKAFPSMKVKEKSKPEPAPTPTEPAASQLAKGSTKPKKHKPMGKAEQERNLAKIREIKAQFQNRGSGSQEPLPSVENQQATRDEDESDESDADSEED